MTDPFDLQRFVTAQEPVDTVLSELRAGRKRTHWMWFIFPQLGGLGHSSMAEYYGISSLAEARAYLAHSVLGHDSTSVPGRCWRARRYRSMRFSARRMASSSGHARRYSRSRRATTTHFNARSIGGATASGTSERSLSSATIDDGQCRSIRGNRLGR